MSDRLIERDAPSIPDGPTFSQLAGMPEAQQWGIDLVQDIFLYRIGALSWEDIDAGIIVHGPPGTGKTTFAKALAASSRLPLIATSYADWNRGEFVADVIGEMRRVFEFAAEHAPCVLAIDELDSIPSRDILKTERGVPSSMVVNALLERLDGLNTKEGIVVVATCNHPDRLDPALTRPGRLGKKIRIGLPGIDAIPQILAYHLKSDATTIGDLKSIAILCGGMSGADIEQVVREARQSARRKQRPIQKSDIVSILEARVATLTPEHQKFIAVHEAGHAVAAYHLLNSNQITLSIVPSAEGLGEMTARLTASPMTRESALNTITTLLAGRAAEEIIIGSISGGAGGSAKSDLARASEIALTSIARLGLSEDTDPFWHGPFETLGINTFSPDRVIEARELVQHCYGKAKDLITQHRGLATLVAQALVKHRALAHQDFLDLVKCYEGRPRPQPGRTTPGANAA